MNVADTVLAGAPVGGMESTIQRIIAILREDNSHLREAGEDGASKPSEQGRISNFLTCVLFIPA